MSLADALIAWHVNCFVLNMNKHVQNRKSRIGFFKSGMKGLMMGSFTEHKTGPPQKRVDEISKVMYELDQLKRQSERLDMINQLHGRLAGVLSISGMIEAYSVWLMPIVEHELIGLNNYSKNKKYLFCSGHGPNRRRAIAFAERVIEHGDAKHQGIIASDGQLGHKWVFDSLEDTSILLIFNKDRKTFPAEIEVVNDSLHVFAESLQRGVEYEDLFEQASTDPLTGLFNRRVFEDRVTRMMNGSDRYGSPLTMLSLDLDFFKQINDNLGHQRGDEVLQSVARVLNSAVRSTDLLVRMGGDEFLLVLDNTDKEQARILAERLVKRIEGLEVWATDDIKLGASIGLAEVCKKESLRSWLDRTDDLLYHAKVEGRSRVAVDYSTA